MVYRRILIFNPIEDDGNGRPRMTQIIVNISADLNTARALDNSQ